MSNKIKKQFDVIVGNPPYQNAKERKTEAKKGSCGSRLWQFFVDISFVMVKENGYISLVHPSLWRKPENNLFEKFKKGNLIYLEMHSLNDGIKTFGANTAYDWYILQKKEYDRKTVVKDIYGNLDDIDISNLFCIPSCSLTLFKKLIAKEGEEKCNVIYDRTKYGTDKKWMSKEKDNIFKFPCVYMNTLKDGVSLWYSNTNKNGHFGVKKVIISENGGHLGAYNDYKGEYGLTQFMFSIVINNKEEGNNIIKAIKSEKFKKVWESSQWMSNHREWRTFKYFRKDFWKEFI